MIATDTNSVEFTRSGTGGDGEDSAFAGSRAKGGNSGQGILGGGSGGEMVFGRMHVTTGEYKVVVGRGGKGAKDVMGTNYIVGKGGDGAPGIVIIRYRKDGGTDDVDEATAIDQMTREANKAIQPAK